MGSSESNPKEILVESIVASINNFEYVTGVEVCDIRLERFEMPEAGKIAQKSVIVKIELELK